MQSEKAEAEPSRGRACCVSRATRRAEGRERTVAPAAHGEGEAR